MKIKARELRQGDVFIFDDREQIVIDTMSKDSLWVTNRQCYLTNDKREQGFSYGYTNATIISIKSEKM